MRSKKLFRAVGDVDDDLVVEAESERAAKSPVRLVVLRWGAVAACVAIIAGIGIRLSTQRSIDPIQPIEHIAGTEPYGEIPGPRAETPTGPRRFFNWAGYRYAVADDGWQPDFSQLAMGEPLGVLEYNVFDGLDDSGANHAEVDGATTFAVGGGVYEMPGYDPVFRLAVEQDGAWYMAELVARVDDSPLGAADYFRAADLEPRLRGADILPHFGEQTLRSVDRDTAAAMTRALAQAQPADMTDERYEALAGAQAQGRSWRLCLRLEDGTAVLFYILPDLGIFSIGDGYYELPAAFAADYAELFADLPLSAIPAE